MKAVVAKAAIESVKDHFKTEGIEDIDLDFMSDSEGVKGIYVRQVRSGHTPGDIRTVYRRTTDGDMPRGRLKKLMVSRVEGFIAELYEKPKTETSEANA